MNGTQTIIVHILRSSDTSSNFDRDFRRILQTSLNVCEEVQNEFIVSSTISRVLNEGVEMQQQVGDTRIRVDVELVGEL